MTTVLSGVFAALALVFALLASFAARKCAAQHELVTTLVRALSGERSKLAAHDAELDQITETLRKLSGRIGAVRKEARATDSPSEVDADTDAVNRLTWKAQMREKYGVTPAIRR